MMKGKQLDADGLYLFSSYFYFSIYNLALLLRTSLKIVLIVGLFCSSVNGSSDHVHATMWISHSFFDVE